MPGHDVGFQRMPEQLVEEGTRAPRFQHQVTGGRGLGQGESGQRTDLAGGCLNPPHADGDVGHVPPHDLGAGRVAGSGDLHGPNRRRAGAVAVMALERVPSDIRASGGVARMSDPEMITGIMAAVSIPVMAKARIGHFVEAQVLEALGVDYIDESEVLTPADERNHIDKHPFKVPFVCGCRNLGEALRRVNEGAAMMRTKGEAGTGNVVEAVHQLRDVLAEIRRLQGMREDELFVAAKELQAPYDLVRQVAADGRMPVVNFVAGGISTPADAALVMQLGAEGVFVGSGIFKAEDPARMANAIVQATTHFQDARIIAEVSKGLGAPMRGIAMEAIPDNERLAVRGW